MNPNSNSWFQLGATALIASIVTAVTIFAINPSLKCKENVNKAQMVKKERKSELSEQEEAILSSEQLARTSAFFGLEAMPKLSNSFIVVVGCGGVGSWAINMLIRNGVGKIRIIDFDHVTLSSLNRHAMATRSDVGRSKVEVIKRWGKNILPSCDIEAINEMFEGSKAEFLLGGNPDYILDCIDNLDTKVELLKYCYQNKLKVISSMGAGAKSDPTRIHVADISDTFEDPLARSVRRQLKLSGILGGIPTVYSSEKPGPVKLLPLDEAKAEEATDYSILPSFRARILPVLGTIPALFGMTMASYIICLIAEHPIEPLAIKSRHGLYNNILRDSIAREEKLYSNKDIQLDKNQVSFLVEEVYRGKSVISKLNDKLALVRFHPKCPLSITNSVLITKKEAVSYEEYIKEEKDLNEFWKEYDSEIRKRLEIANNWVKHDFL